MKKGLVLAGGGTRGAYQAGAVRAYRQYEKNDWDIVVGTSVGSLNAALIVQKDYEALDELYQNLRSDQIIQGIVPTEIDRDVLLNRTTELKKEIVQYVKERGVDITPFEHTVHAMYTPEKFFQSDVAFGCMVATHLNHSPVYITKKEMKEHGEDWLIASASCYPAFPLKTIDGKDYVDGGYYDNCAIDFALKLGAEEVDVIDLNCEPNHPEFIEKSNIAYQFPQSDTGNFLQFDHDVVMRLYARGYNDACKMMHVYSGLKYTFEKTKLPSSFKEWYIALERFETGIYRTSHFVNSASVITDMLKKQTHRNTLSDAQYFFSMLDNVMDLFDFDETIVYTLPEVKKRIHLALQDAYAENYAYTPAVSIKDFIKSLDKLGRVKYFLHEDIFPDHVLLPDTVMYSVYPLEKALADFIYLCLGGKHGKNCKV